MSTAKLPADYQMTDGDYYCVVSKGHQALLPAKQVGSGETLDMLPGDSITDAAASFGGTVRRIGDIIETTIAVDLAGLRSTAAGDIIGDDGSSEYAHIGQIKADVNGTIFGGKVECLELPAGGDPDIDLYSADEATGIEDAAITSLTETQLLDAGDHAANAFKSLTAFPAADEYLYLVAGAGATVNGDYTAGILVITLYGK